MIRFTRSQIRAFGEMSLWMLRRRRRVRVEGRSMEPTFHAGDRVLVSPYQHARANDIVVARHPENERLLVMKRVAQLVGTSKVVLTSDNLSEGTDSRTWGPVSRDLIVGVVTLHIERLFADHQSQEN